MSAETKWKLSPAKLAVGANQVHVWRSKLDSTPQRIALWRNTLSADELARAARFYSPVHRDRFIAGRGILRRLLARYLGTPARDLKFCVNAYGKPGLAPGQGGADLRFSLSHSAGLALFAFRLRHDVGVDLEYVRPSERDHELAARFFSPREVETIRASPVNARHAMFFHCWARKEAYIKARGIGFATSLSGFAVSLGLEENAHLTIESDQDDGAHQWCLRQLEPGEDCIGAVAAEGLNWSLNLWEYEAEDH